MSFPGDLEQSLSDFLGDYLVKDGGTYAPKASFFKVDPRAKWEYSNVAIALAGYVVERVRKKILSTHVKKNILDPLSAENAHLYIRDDSA